MKVSTKEIDKLNFELTIKVSKEDFEPVKKKKLSAIRAKADIKGFRKGMAPLSLIERIYGEQSLSEAVNDIVSEQINKFISGSKHKFVGEPLSAKSQKEIDWSGNSDMEFVFDLACATEVNIEAGKEDKLPKYVIKSTKKAKDEMKKNLLQQYGELQEVEVSDGDSYIYLDLDQEDGRKVENAYISVRDVTNKDKFTALKANDKLVININEDLSDEGDRSRLLKCKREELETINPVFNATVVNVKNFMPAKAGQETYDKIYGKDKVHSIEEFEAEIEKALEANYAQEADYRLSKDIKDYFLKKAAIELPEAFLKRYLVHINKDKFTEEQIDKEFDAFLADYKWDMVRDFFAKKYDVKVSQEDLDEAARGFASYQYAMYGMNNIPEDFLKEYARKLLNDRKQVENLAQSVLDSKVISSLKEAVTLEEKGITVEKFRELK